VKNLHISNELKLPIDFVTGTQGILATKGMGKTYLAQVEAEELLAHGQQIVAIDPTDAWWGLRSSADGKHDGYPIAIFGGDHGDLQLEHAAGADLADAVIAERFSCVICTEGLSASDEVRFVREFLDRLYRKNREPIHVFVDEADMFAPQKPFDPEDARAIRAMSNVVRRGRKKGIGCTMITQRPSVINKDVLSQVDLLMVLGMSHNLDIEPVEKWIRNKRNPDLAAELLESLPTLQQGDAWAWAPRAGIYRRFRARRKSTFDSGATPKPGERPRVAKKLTPVDIERLGKTLSAAAEEQRANDPKTLRARIAELEKQLAAKPAGKVETKAVKEPVLDKRSLAALTKAVDGVERHLVGLAQIVDRMAQAQQVIASEGDNLRKFAARIQAPQPTNREIAARAFANDGKVTKLVGKHQIRVKPMRPTTAESGLPVGEAATLRALIQYPGGLNRRQLTVLTGYKRSTRDAYLLRLLNRGYVEYSGERVFATQAALLEMPDAEPLPTGLALRDWWEQKLPAGERAVLVELCTSYPRAVKREDIDAATGFKRSTRDAYLSRLAAKELVTEPQRGYVRASDQLFDGGEVP
jgi:uncharacterized protein